jgi:hypothetical protein
MLLSCLLSIQIRIFSKSKLPTKAFLKVVVALTKGYAMDLGLCTRIYL